MMTKRLLVALQMTLAVVAGSIPTVARAADSVDGSSGQAEPLDKIQAQSHEMQQKLFAARLQHDDDEVRRLTKELKELQSQEVELLRASGQLPR
jgi:uncharacterized membrane protein (DUF106 family)